MVARNFAKVKDGVRFSVAALRANKLSPGGREEVCNTSVKRFDSVFALFSTFFGFLITKNVKVGYDIILFHTTKSYKQIRCFSLKTIVELKKNLPRSLKTEVERYIREQEDNPNRFDSTVLHARKALKRLYALLHIAPSERAQSILFDNDPPEDSQLFVLKKVVKEENPTEQARLLIESKIPYRVASSVVKNMTPTIVFALVDAMSDQELINNVSALKRRGAFDNEELKTLINSRLKKAKKSKKVSAVQPVGV